MKGIGYPGCCNQLSIRIGILMTKHRSSAPIAQWPTVPLVGAKLKEDQACLEKADFSAECVDFEMSITHASGEFNGCFCVCIYLKHYLYVDMESGVTIIEYSPGYQDECAWSGGKVGRTLGLKNKEQKMESRMKVGKGST